MNFGVGLNLGESKFGIIDGKVGIYLFLLGIGIKGRRDWRGFVFQLYTGKAWIISLGFLGLWGVIQLEQPEWKEGEEIQKAKRVFKWGFNYFQRAGS